MDLSHNSSKVYGLLTKESYHIIVTYLKIWRKLFYDI